MVNNNQVKEINERHTNEHYLPECFLDNNSRLLDLTEAMKGGVDASNRAPNKKIMRLSSQNN